MLIHHYSLLYYAALWTITSAVSLMPPPTGKRYLRLHQQLDRCHTMTQTQLWAFPQQSCAEQTDPEGRLWHSMDKWYKQRGNGNIRVGVCRWGREGRTSCYPSFPLQKSEHLSEAQDRTKSSDIGFHGFRHEREFKIVSPSQSPACPLELKQAASVPDAWR
jgi:hypothetical protein